MRGYAFLGTSIGVASDLPSIASWLDEFLLPAFAPWVGDEPDFVVRIVSERRAHDMLAATRPPGPLERTPTFLFDQEVVSLPSWTTARGIVIADARRGAFYVLHGTQAEVVVRPDSTRLRVGPMRVVREIATVRALSKVDCLQIHAAALEANGRGILLAGAKGAGKTTALGYLASARGARILANDRVFVRTTKNGVAIHGVPTIVSVRAGTSALLPRLAHGVAAIERPAHLSLAEHDAALAHAGEARGSSALKLSPPQLARQLGVALAASAPLAAIAFPATRLDRRGFTVEHLDAREAKNRLHAARFGADSGAGALGATEFERFTRARRPANADAPLIAAVSNGIPCFVLRIGAGCFGEARAALDVLARLAGS